MAELDIALAAPTGAQVCRCVWSARGAPHSTCFQLHHPSDVHRSLLSATSCLFQAGSAPELASIQMAGSGGPLSPCSPRTHPSDRCLQGAGSSGLLSSKVVVMGCWADGVNWCGLLGAEAPVIVRDGGLIAKAVWGRHQAP